MQNCSTPKKSGMNSENADVDSFLDSTKKENVVRVATRLFKIILTTSKKELFVKSSLTLVGFLLPVLLSLLWKNVLEIITKDILVINSSNLILIFVIFAIVGGLSVSFAHLSEVIDTIFRNKLSLKLQAQIHKKSEKIPVVYYEVPKLNDIISKAQEAFCYGPAIGASMGIIALISILISLIISMVILWSFHYSLVILVFVIGVPYGLKIYINRVKLDFNIKYSPKRREGNIYKNYITSYEFVKETQVLNAKDFFIKKWLKVMGEVKKEEVKINIKVISIETLIDILESIGYVLSIFLAMHLVSKRLLNVGQFGAVVLLIGELKSSITIFLMQLSDMHEELSFVRKGFEYVDLKEEHRPGKVSPDTKQGITCENVSFTYPLTSTKVIDNLNVDIKKGEIIAVVGANGAGKSTFAKLLLGLITPNEGKVKYDGKDISEISYKAIHKNTSAVFQDFNRYYLTVGENIGLSNTNNIMDSGLMLEAAKKSGVISFVEKLPNGFDTVLGKAYGGIDLSGGQWQQLALARGYFRDGDFIILDEPSSALDPLKEAAMYEKFKELCANKIGVIITHRLGAARLANKIFLMESGQIIECGTHEELCDKRAKYWEMFTSQADMYKNDSHEKVHSSI